MGRRSATSSPTTATPATHQWYDGTPRPGSSSGSGTSSRRWTTRTPSTPASRTPRCSAPPTAAAELAGADRPAQPRHRARSGSPGAGGMCLHTIILDPTRRRPDVHRHLGGGRVPHRRRRRDLEADQPAACAPGSIPDPDAEVGHCVHHIAMHPSRPDTLFMQKHWDVMRSDDAGENWREVSGEPADRLRLPDRRARPRAGDDLRRPDQERLRALPAGRQAARLPQPHRRRRVGAADQGPAAGGLLRQRAARRDGRRHARRVRHLLRHHRRPGLRLADGGDSWAPIVRDLPAVLSVEVQTLP